MFFFIFSLLSIFSKFWTRHRPGGQRMDRYNLYSLPGMSADGVEYSLAVAKELKAAMEQGRSSKSQQFHLISAHRRLDV